MIKRVFLAFLFSLVASVSFAQDIKVVYHVNTGVEIPTHMQDIEKYVRGIESSTGRSVRFYPILYKPFENDRGKQAIEYYKGLARATGGKCRVIPRAP